MATYTGRLGEPALKPEHLVQRMRRSTLARFLAVGGISYAVNQALLFLLYERVFGKQDVLDFGPLRQLDGGLLLASLLAMELSILVRFALNDAWTFRGRGGSSFLTRLVQSNVSSLGSPVIALGCLNLMTPLLGISYLIANSFGIALGLAWNWAWSSRVIWRLEASTELAPLPTLIEETR
jgi:putative flippase GtrA